MKAKAATLAGLIGMVLIQSNTVPVIIGTINGGSLPPLIMTVQSIIALALLLAHACYNRFALYVAGNAFGLIGQCAVLFLTLKG